MVFPLQFWLKALFLGALGGFFLSRLLVAVPVLFLGAAALLKGYVQSPGDSSRAARVEPRLVFSALLPALVWAAVALFGLYQLQLPGAARLLSPESGPLRWGFAAALLLSLLPGLPRLPGKLREYRRKFLEPGYIQKCRRTRLLSSL